MDIQALHMENNAYRDLIKDLKRKINEYDGHIRSNEQEIGRQLNDMNKDAHSKTGCELCMGECSAEEY